MAAPAIGAAAASSMPAHEGEHAGPSDAPADEHATDLLEAPSDLQLAEAWTSISPHSFPRPSSANLPGGPRGTPSAETEESAQQRARIVSRRAAPASHTPSPIQTPVPGKQRRPRKGTVGTPALTLSRSPGGTAETIGGYLVLRLPQKPAAGTSNGGGSRQDTPVSERSKGQKRRLEAPTEPSHPSRPRASPPIPAHIRDEMTDSRGASPSGSHSRLSAPADIRDIAQPVTNSLSIFAPPPPAGALPEALQDVIRPSSAALRETDEDTMMKEAADGFESRLRPREKKEADVKTGVSASGKGVKVGGSARGQPKVKKGPKANGDTPNQDFCSACRGIGKFLCCDGCPRSFHFMCLEPPLRVDELPDDETWYCKKCRTEQSPRASPSSPKERDLRPVPTVFKTLIHRIEVENPTQFRLPPEITQFFAGVAADKHGAYLDDQETRTKTDRKGFQEERDGVRLRDGKARPVVCYACGGSSIPLHSLTTDPEASWRPLVSCDYCAIHWHLDCLNPPLATMPNSSRKWMCPNHAEQVMKRRRTVREHLELVDVEYRNQANNGNIVVVPDERALPKLEFEDMIINKRKYRVPEKIIRLDFWDKVGLGKKRSGQASAKHGRRAFRRRANSDSSLTSLDESREEDESPPIDDLEAANLILGLLRDRRPTIVVPPVVATFGQSLVDRSLEAQALVIQTTPPMTPPLLHETSLSPPPSSSIIAAAPMMPDQPVPDVQPAPLPKIMLRLGRVDGNVQ